MKWLIFSSMTRVLPRRYKQTRSQEFWRGSLTGSFGGNALEDVVHERVQDSHGLVRDTSVWVNLLKD